VGGGGRQISPDDDGNPPERALGVGRRHGRLASGTAAPVAALKRSAACLVREDGRRDRRRSSIRSAPATERRSRTTGRALGPCPAVRRRDIPRFAPWLPPLRARHIQYQTGVTPSSREKAVNCEVLEACCVHSTCPLNLPSHVRHWRRLPDEESVWSRLAKRKETAGFVRGIAPAASGANMERTKRGPTISGVS
jgi:hypothetical protein